MSFSLCRLALPAFGADERADILSRIEAPKFPDREFDISKFGAVEGGKKDSTEAIAKSDRSLRGGGRRTRGGAGGRFSHWRDSFEEQR